MIWLTWRQHRTQFLTTAALAGALCVLMAAIGRGVSANFRESGLADCVAAGADCEALRMAFDERYGSLQLLIVLILVCPLLIGLFWGAPLIARELEHGTHRLVWAQSVTRRRWVVSKLAFTTAAAVLVAVALTALASWLAHPFNEVFGARLQPGVFDLQGVVPVAYTLFAFAAGAAAGAVLRKTLPAMGATLAAFVATRVVVGAFVRPRLLPTKVIEYATLEGRPAEHHGAFAVDEKILDSAGRVFSADGDLRITPMTIREWCPDLAGTVQGAFPEPGSMEPCLARLGLRTIETIHPAKQYWAFQLVESALFLGAAAALLGFTVWWVLRKAA